MYAIRSYYDIPVTILPDYSERLEGPSWEEYQAIQKGGTTISAIEKMNVALHSMEFGAVLALAAEKGHSYDEHLFFSDK